jgi:hypothetical protein
MHNINPRIWGPPGWKFMHYVTLSYPNNPTLEHKENAKMFFLSAGKLLPCESCQVHFSEHLVKYPLDDKVLSCGTNLVEWFMNVHNEVNKIQGKDIYTLDRLYKEYMGSISHKSYTSFYILCVVMIILVLAFVYVKCMKS